MIFEFDFQKEGLSDHKDNDYSIIFSVTDKTTYNIMMKGRATMLKATRMNNEIRINKNRGQLALNDSPLNLSDINLISETIIRDSRIEITATV